MIWQKNVYDSLTNCATLCDEFATECSQIEATEGWYRSIFLSLDCADLCRQLAMLYVRGSENTSLLAKVCLDVCEKCAEEVGKFDFQRCQQVRAQCQQTILSCISIVDVAHHTDASNNPSATSESLPHGIDLREIVYN